MRGINYGHHFHPTTYNHNQALEELKHIKSVGYESVRIAYPPYNGTSMTMCRDMVETSLSIGLHVMWGVTGARPAGGQTSEQVDAHSTYVKEQVIPYILSLNNDNIEFSVGNEEEMPGNFNSSSITKSELQTKLKTLIEDCQELYPGGSINYVTSAEFRSDWHTLGVPVGARIGMNVYYEVQANGTFLAVIRDLVNKFGSSLGVTEWGMSNGFADVEDFSDAEEIFAIEMDNRQDILGDINQWVFCYRDGSFGVPPNSFALIKTDGTRRLAWQSLTGDRTIRARDFSTREYSDRTP